MLSTFLYVMSWSNTVGLGKVCVEEGKIPWIVKCVGQYSLSPSFTGDDPCNVGSPPDVGSVGKDNLLSLASHGLSCKHPCNGDCGSRE